MKDVLEALQMLQDTPVPTLVVVVGAIFLLLAFVGKIGATIELPAKRQKWAGVIGALLMISGIVLFIIPDTDSTSDGGGISTPSISTPIQKIDFDYQDSPTKHGWSITDGDETQIAFEHIYDDTVASAITISSSARYGMDFEVGPAAAEFGEQVEFVARFEEQYAAIYVFISLEQDDGSTTTGWLKFHTGEGQPKPVVTATATGNDEWLVYIKPTLHVGEDWLLFQVDLEDAVRDTFGKDGWSFQQLRKIRVRGDLSLDYISVLGRQP